MIIQFFFKYPSFQDRFLGTKTTNEENYIRLLKTRLEEHKKDVENGPREQYTRSRKKWSVYHQQVCSHRSHYNENHIIDWEGIKVVGRESHIRRHVKERIWIQKTETAIN